MRHDNSDLDLVWASFSPVDRFSTRLVDISFT